jgi:hypothetical protein
MANDIINKWHYNTQYPWQIFQVCKSGEGRSSVIYAMWVLSTITPGIYERSRTIDNSWLDANIYVLSTALCLCLRQLVLSLFHQRPLLLHDRTCTVLSGSAMR